jgi:hypothetical protein
VEWPARRRLDRRWFFFKEERNAMFDLIVQIVWFILTATMAIPFVF